MIIFSIKILVFCFLFSTWFDSRQYDFIILFIRLTNFDITKTNTIAYIIENRFVVWSIISCFVFLCAGLPSGCREPPKKDGTAEYGPVDRRKCLKEHYSTTGEEFMLD